jgi:hypothetical protein
VVEKILRAKIKMLVVLLVVVIFAVYGIELGIRILIADGKIEYFVVDLIVIALLSLVAWRFYGRMREEKEKIW